MTATSTPRTRAAAQWPETHYSIDRVNRDGTRDAWYLGVAYRDRGSAQWEADKRTKAARRGETYAVGEHPIGKDVTSPELRRSLDALASEISGRLR